MVPLRNNSLTRKLFFTLFALSATVYALNEPTTDNVAIGLTGTCLARQDKDPCLNRAGNPIPNQPQDFPCPCLPGDLGGSCFPGTGKVEDKSDDVGSFSDDVLVSSNLRNFVTLTGMAFTDNTQELFICTKAGQIFRYDLVYGTVSEWLDLSSDVHTGGDYGMMSIETHPDFTNNPYVYVSFATAAIAGPNGDMNAISYVKIFRITQLSGNADPTSIITILGQDKSDSNVLCATSHMGGALGFGHDGSLFVTLGDGGHFDTDIMDFGIINKDRYPYDDQCLAQFGESQAIGSLRAQSMDSLGGKLIRIDPATGDGICTGDWTVFNPYCNENHRSTRSRIWALGFRNPHTMNVKPLAKGEKVEGPGVVYVGDVGLGSFEEVNVATTSGMNFGWPCWEGPQPMGGYRDSNLNDLSITTVRRPHTDDGTPFSCPYVYANVTTTHPMFYYSRYDASMDYEWRGLYNEVYMMNAGFLGNCIGGVTFYTGDNYPAAFKDRVFILDYGSSWIKTLQMDDQDHYQSVHAFKSDFSTSIVSLETNPNTGDVCYIAIVAGEIHCITYSASSPPPTVQASANVTAGSPGLTVAFNVDGSLQRDNNKSQWIAWDFTDGSPILVTPNPVHTFNESGIYNVSVVVNAAGFNVSKTIRITVQEGLTVPTATIRSPVTTNGFYGFKPNEVMNFVGEATGGSGDYSYYWDTYMVHSNHYHPESAQNYNANWSADPNTMGASSHTGLRVNFLTFLTVTDSNGNKDTTFIRMRETDWQTAYGNNAPVASFTVGGYQPYETGQFVRFDASPTDDIDIDYLLYKWDFGDGSVQDFSPKNARMVTSHAYSAPGTYVIRLTVQDNWGGEDSVQTTITVGKGFVQNPPEIDHLIIPQDLETTSDSSSDSSETEETSSPKTVVTSGASVEDKNTNPEFSTEGGAASGASSSKRIFIGLACLLVVFAI